MPGLTEDQLDHFNREGYVVAEDVLDPAASLDPVVHEYEGVLDRLADQLFAEGTISSTYAGLPLAERLTKIYIEAGKVFSQYFEPTLPQMHITEDTPMWTGPAVFNLLRNQGLLDLVESIIGPEILSNPVQHVRIKPPEDLVSQEVLATGGGVTPWHQDNGTVTEDADETDMITVWMPLFDATEESGCLVVVPNSFRDGLLEHCPSKAHSRLSIPTWLFHSEAATPLPMRRGSVLLMHRRTIHCSMPNMSRQARWSNDFRYQPTSQPTGRDSFPGFVARSRSNPAAELHDAQAWSEMWVEARRALSQGELPRFKRWDTDSPTCA